MRERAGAEEDGAGCLAGGLLLLLTASATGAGLAVLCRWLTRWITWG